MKKNKRLSKVWSKRHLPEELWPEILSRLPVKALLRFRCVSKAWLSLIKDPEFCRLHLKNFKNNSDETHLLVVEGKQQNCVVRCSDTFEATTKTLLSLGHINDQKSWEFQCSIDGLVLLNKYFQDGDSILNYLRVWNPSIRKFHDIPSLPEIESSLGRSFIFADIGLGYDPIIKDYKHVRLIFEGGDMLHSVAVYTLGAGSWKIIQFKGIGFSDWRWDTDTRFNWETTYLQGHLYFIAEDCSELVSIDLSNEVFRCTSLPEGSWASTYEFESSLALVDGGRSLAVINFQYYSNMWVLESPISESEPVWTKCYSFSDLEGSRVFIPQEER